MTYSNNKKIYNNNKIGSYFYIVIVTYCSCVFALMLLQLCYYVMFKTQCFIKFKNSRA